METLATPSARARQRSDAGEPRSERPSGHQETRNGTSHFASSRPVRGARPVRPVRAAPADPFFDRPYEASASEAPPTWESKPAPGSTLRQIKAKRKVPALFKPAGSV